MPVLDAADQQIVEVDISGDDEFQDAADHMEVGRGIYLPLKLSLSLTVGIYILCTVYTGTVHISLLLQI